MHWLYDWGGLNEALFLFIYSFQTPWLHALMLVATELGYYKYLGLYATLMGCCALSRSTKSQNPAQQALYWLFHLTVLLAGCTLAIQLTEWLKDFFALPRPYVTLPGIERTVNMAANAGNRSFPSGHSAFSAALAASLWPLIARQWRWGLVLFPLWVGLSRVTLGVHFPADLAAGWLLGVGSVLIIRRLLKPYTATLDKT